MGSVDVERQALNVFRMRLLGAQGHPGGERLEDAEGRRQRGAARLGHQRAHDVLPARLGDGAASLPDDGARLPARDRRGGARAGRAGHRAGCPICSWPAWAAAPTPSGSSGPSSRTGACASSAWSPAATGIASGKHGASLTAGAVGVLHGSMSYVLQNDDGQVAEAHSISAGLDYPGRGPRARLLQGRGALRVRVGAPTTRPWRRFQTLTRLEGIMPALESAHAVAYAMRAARADEEEPDRGGGAVRARRQGRAHRAGLDAAAADGHGGERARRREPARTHTFAALRARGERALVPYFTAGDPSLAVTARLVVEAARQGADVIELGVPFSDPLADGPVIQRATQRALAAGSTLPARARDGARAPRRGRGAHRLPHLLQSRSSPSASRRSAGPRRRPASTA